MATNSPNLSPASRKTHKRSWCKKTCVRERKLRTPGPEGQQKLVEGITATRPGGPAGRSALGVQRVHVFETGIAQQQRRIVHIEPHPVVPISRRLKILQVRNTLDVRIAQPHPEHRRSFRPTQEIKIRAVLRPVRKADVSLLEHLG